MRANSFCGRVVGASGASGAPGLLLWLSCFLGLGHLSATADELVRADVRLDSAEIAFESTATLTLNVAWNPDRVALSPQTAPEPKLKRLKLSSVTTYTEAPDADSLVRREYRYTLSPTAEGTGLIDPFTIGYITLADSSSGTVSTNSASVKIKAPVVTTGESSNHLFWIAGGLILLVAGVVFFLLKRRGRSDQPEDLDPLERRLAELKSLTSQPRSKFYTELYQLLDDILHERGVTAAKPGDTHGMIADIEVSTLPGSLRNKLIHWLEESARRKFAPAGGTPGDTLRLYFEVESALRERWPENTGAPETARSSG